MDNWRVVLYGPSLAFRYDAHINVEICSFVQAVKYIHMYIFKGSDEALALIAQPDGATDEITNVITAR